MAGFKGLHTEELIPFAQQASPAGAAADIHPEYYLILPRMFDENIRNKFDEWIYTLKTSKVKSEFTASGIKEAGVKLDMLKMEPDERKAYERFQEVKANEESILNTAVHDERIKIAKKMKAGGMDAITTAKLTGLTVEEIRIL
ncbi:MAG: hypothetical protein LBH93_05075 [Chitinispirillales bacterium]|jgi:hypothetical protein|nr:hypothetical protein [Chitinispirillales bacterium]